MVEDELTRDEGSDGNPVIINAAALILASAKVEGRGQVILGLSGVLLENAATTARAMHQIETTNTAPLPPDTYKLYWALGTGGLLNAAAGFEAYANEVFMSPATSRRT